MTSLVLALLCTLQADPAPLTEERLEVIAREAMADVERASSQRFLKKPRIKISERKEVEEILAVELLPQIKVLQPDTPPEKMADAARDMGRSLGMVLMAKYSFRDDCIHVVPETAKRMAELLKSPDVQAEGTLRVIVTHEMVHALDEQTMKVCDRLATLKTTVELEIWSALLEGHAQHLTRRIFIERQEEKLFDGYERLILAGPPGMSEAEKALTAVMSQAAKFAYLDGRAFFDGLAKSGKATYVADAFRNPPKEKNGLLHPERFYAPAAAAGPVVDLGPAFEVFSSTFKDTWSRQKGEMDESTLKTVFGDFVDAKAVEESLKTLLLGRTILLTPKAEPGSRVAILFITRHKDAAAAERFRDLSIALSRAKDERMKTGAIHIAKSETVAIKTPAGNPVSLLTKTLAVQTEEVVVRSAVASRGTFHLELLYSNEETTPEDLSKMVDQVWATLQKLD